jgi:hypothetical protein
MVIVLIVLGGLMLLVGFARPSPLLQALGALILGAGLSALIGALTGRQAVEQQSAREANLMRKRETYGPLYAELKALRTALSRAKDGEAPAPQLIDNDVEATYESLRYVPRSAAVPTLKWWPQFRRDFRDNDFRPVAQSLFDDVQALATTYNNAVEAAREAAIPILASHIDSAIGAEKQSDRYQRWIRQQAAHAASSALAGHELKTNFDWFGFFEGALGRILAAQWLTYWPAGMALSYSQAMGWVLAKQPGKAASYIQRNYPAEGTGTYPPPPLVWIQPIFEQAWTEMQQDATICAALDATEALLTRVQEATDMLADLLRRIQKRFEGGEPM